MDHRWGDESSGLLGRGGGENGKGRQQKEHARQKTADFLVEPSLGPSLRGRQAAGGPGKVAAGSACRVS